MATVIASRYGAAIYRKFVLTQVFSLTLPANSKEIAPASYSFAMTAIYGLDGIAIKTLFTELPWFFRMVRPAKDPDN